MDTLINKDELKDLLKEIINEVFEEKKNMFHDLFIEAIEDIGLVNAIKEGESSKSIGKDKIFKILEG